ncbi:MAG: hypothetical protein HYX39_02550 [Bacteroidetes bacterium]|nr:hypothetical protein [Bacteroidota bacterium]
MLSLVLFLIAQNHFCQSERPVRSKDIVLAEPPMAVHSKSAPAEASSYFGYDNKLKEILIKETFLSLVPQKDQNQSKADYLNILNKWIKSHPDLIKPELQTTQLN